MPSSNIILINRETALSSQPNLLRLVSTTFLILMCIQLFAIEGTGTSAIKVVAMLLMIVFMLSYASYVSKALIWGGLYLFTLLISIIANIESFRLDTVLYRYAAVMAFIAFYNMVYYKQVFSLDYFIKIIKGLIASYVVVLIIQQILKILIFNYSSVPFINLISLDRNIFSVNSLSLEPSHTARILGALGIVLIRMYECFGLVGGNLIKAIWKDSKWIIIGLLWALLSMASGTAIIALFMIVLTLLRKQITAVGIAILIIISMVLPNIKYEPIERIYKTMNAVTSLDRETIQSADLSASARVLPFVYTIKHFNLSEKDTWLGKGIDAGMKNDKWGTKRMIGDMTDYGFVQYIFALGLIYTCCIKRIFSIETVFFIVLLIAEIRNVHVWWAVFMLLSVSKYFMLQKESKYAE